MTEIDPKALALRVADSMGAYLAADGDERSLPAEFVFSDDEARAIAAFLREAVSPWRPISDEAKTPHHLVMLGVVRKGILEEVHIGGYRWQVNADDDACWWSDQPDDEIFPTHWMPLPTPPAAGGGE